jgi:hypothetical protein
LKPVNKTKIKETEAKKIRKERITWLKPTTTAQQANPLGARPTYWFGKS